MFWCEIKMKYAINTTNLNISKINTSVKGLYNPTIYCYIIEYLKLNVSITYLVRLHYNKYVVYSHSKYQKRDNFDNYEGCGNPQIAENSKGRSDRCQYYENATQTEHNFRFDLKICIFK